MDERFAAMPMIKWDHLLRAAPVFCHVVPGSCGGGSKTTKILLGAHRSQEIVMLQYSGQLYRHYTVTYQRRAGPVLCASGLTGVDGCFANNAAATNPTGVTPCVQEATPKPV